MNLVRTMTGQSERPSQYDESVPITHVATSRDSWAGHLNRLTSEQQTALSKFKTVLQEQKLYISDPPSHDDPTLIRYLRARKWEINPALAQFKDSEETRKENRIEELYDSIDLEFYESARRLYPQWTGHRDKRGLPLYVYQIKHLDSKTVHAYTKQTEKWKTHSSWAKVPASPKLLPLYVLYENMLTMVLPLCSTLNRPVMDVPITQGTNIVDVSGVGIKTFWNLKGHMQEASQMATAHFPETLDRIFIIGAPYFFPTVWGWIKRWFDPNTVSKIFVLSQYETKSTLEKYFEPSSIPKAYGGLLDWEYGSLPSMDPEVKQRVGRDWVPGPARWEGQMVPTGTINGKPRERPTPIPESERHPLWTSPEAPPLPGHAPIEATTQDKVRLDKATEGVASMTFVDSKMNGDATSVQKPGPTEAALIVEPPVTPSNDAPTEVPVEKLPSNPTAAMAAALQSTEAKKDVYLNGNATTKPALERFDTAVEVLPNGTA